MRPFDVPRRLTHGESPVRANPRRRICASLTAAAVALGALLALGPASPSNVARASAYTGRATTPIQHVVMIMKENRSFDEYFGRLPGVDGATTGKTSKGATVQLAQTPDPLPNDIDHTPEAWRAAYDGGRMDGFDLESGAYSASGQPLAYSQMRETQIPNYWAYARTYAIGDRMFAPWKGGSFPNNVFSVAAQSGQYSVGTNHRWMWSSVPRAPSGGNPRYWGCDSPAGTVETMMDATGRKSHMFPCYDFQSLPNVLARYGLSWKYYGNMQNKTFYHNGLDALQSVRHNASLWSHVVSNSSFVTDAASGNLPAVSWVLGNHLEHPPDTACNGENEVVRYVDAVMNGPDWASTAIFVYWDEWGGFYDHVPPPQTDGVSFGFRVPLLVISPFTKHGSLANGGYVSHTFYSHLSTLSFVEHNWNLPSLTPKDAAANDMMDLFDFAAPPRPRLVLHTRTCPRLSAAQRELAATEDPD